MHTLTSPTIVSSYQVSDDWSPTSVLIHVATARDGSGRLRYAALIDVGALITGLSSLQVAEFLVSQPEYLSEVQGVAFLDEADRKMVYTRNTGAVVALEECSISLEQRFCF